MISNVPRPPGLRLYAECALLFSTLVAFLVAVSAGIGLTWDESIYFQFSDSITQWLSASDPLSPSTIEKFWAYSPYHNPHPPLMKIFSALTAAAFRNWLPFPLEYRLGTLVYVSLSLTAAYALLRSSMGWLSSFTAILFVVLEPRVLGDMSIATTDAPVAMAWLLAPLLAWKIVATDDPKARRRLWAALFVVYSFAVATKLTGLLIAAPLGAYLVVQHRWRDLPRLFCMILAGLVFMIAVSPEKWRHPLSGIGQFVTYPLTRSSIPISTMYLGRGYAFHLPWHYFLFMSLVTYPVALWLLLPGLISCPKTIRNPLLPIAIALAAWLVLVHLPNTPRHDGVRQFLSVYPLLALLSLGGLMGILALLEADSPRLARCGRWLWPAALASLLATTVWRNHPHELSYYNAFIGGIRGAERSGMELTYYLESVDPGLIASLNENLEGGKTIAIFPYWPELLAAYHQKGVLRAGFRILTEASAEIPDYLLVFRRRGVVKDAWYESLIPLYEVNYDGVSLTKLVAVRKPVTP